MLDGHLVGEEVLRNILPVDKSRKKKHVLSLLTSFIHLRHDCRKAVFTMRDASRRESDRAGPRCQVPVQYVRADILSEWNVERIRKPLWGLLGSVSRLVAELNNETQSMVSTNLTCKISLLVDGTIEVPGADTHPKA